MVGKLSKVICCILVLTLVTTVVNTNVTNAFSSNHSISLNFEEEFDFLIQDPVFIQLEQELATQETMGKIKPMWVPVAATALRVLISKVGKELAMKGWKIARPHIEKALKAPGKYKIDGPGGGGRIIQVRLKSSGKPIFRLDYYPVKTGGPYKLHYHVPPNMKEHHIIF